MARKASQHSSRKTRRPEIIAALFLSGLGAAIFSRVVHLGFVFDDSYLFEGNPFVLQGLTLRSLRWALTANVAGLWHPLTLLSLMLDVQLFGQKAAAHHLVNALLHLANTLLLFDLLRRMTGRTWRSAAVAAFFCAHPLHVESVAWIAERKDVLSTFFGFLAIRFWDRYARRPGTSRFLPVALCFVLSLASKPMLVTLPFVLLLLDYWPLGRFGSSRVLLEKVPLVVLSIVASWIAFLTQQEQGAMSMAGRYPLPVRAANAAAAYLAYLGKTMWPIDLAVMYPHPGPSLLSWKWVLGAALVAAFCTIAFRLRSRLPWLTTGLLWFLGTLVPVIGLIQVGDQAYADRYTYVPLIGIFLAGAWSLPVLLAAPRAWRLPAIVTTAAVLACGVLAARQVSVWKDNTHLYRHAIQVAPGSWMMHSNLGAELLKAGELDEAVRQFQEAVRLQPALTEAHNNLAVALERLGRTEEAIREYRETLRLAPYNARALEHLGAALVRLGRASEALAPLELATRLQSGDAGVWSSLGMALSGMGRWPDALAAFQTAVHLSPARADLHNLVGSALNSLGRHAEAVEALREAVRLQPDNAFFRYHLEATLSGVGGVKNRR